MVSEQDQTTLNFIDSLAKSMAKHGLISVELSDGTKVTRSEKEPYYQALGSQAATLASKTKVTDEQILMNPTAGLEDLNG